MESSFGLYYYGARWYDPALGRFVQADTIVPEASQGSQAWDRYAYVNNNPLRYTDPTGHEDVEHTCYNPEDPGCINNDEKSDLSGINNTETTETPPLPDEPPDFNNPLPDGNPPPPNVNGLPNDQWELGNWSGLGRGYKNAKDPRGPVYRPDKGYKNTGNNNGEMPHWHVRSPGTQDTAFPENYQWGYPGQRKYPGEYNKPTGRYEMGMPELEDIAAPASVPIGFYVVYRIVRAVLSPACGPGLPVCVLAP